jgi:nucleoside transporter
MDRSVPPRLAGMMFLQYFGLGAWVIALSRYLITSPDAGGLGFKATEVGFIYTTLAVGGLVGPLFIGVLADRYFAAEKLLAALHAVMAGMLVIAGAWCDTHAGPNANPADAVGPLFGIMIGVSLATQTTMILTNVVSFRNLTVTGNYGYIRLVGTVGWALAGLLTGWVFRPISPEPLYVAAGTSAVMAVFSLYLPHTPPKGVGRSIGEVIGLPAVKLFRDRSFVVFALCLFFGNALNQFYGLFAPAYLADIGVKLDLGKYGTLGPEVVMTIAQYLEIFCMAAVPLLLPRVGLKPIMVMGLCGWALRGALLYLGNVPLVVAVAVPMHGWAFAFFGMMAMVFVDREAPQHLRAGGQALVAFLASGPAALLGNIVSSRVVLANRTDAGRDWGAIWLIPFVGYVVILVVFVLLFREPRQKG